MSFEYNSPISFIILYIIISLQDCALRSTKVPNHEILGAQRLRLYENSKFFQLPKGKSWLPVAARPLEHSPVLIKYISLTSNTNEIIKYIIWSFV